MISSKKIKFIALILIVISFVMLWYGCFSRNAFGLEINADEIYRIEGFRYGVPGRQYITNRDDVQRIVRRLNSYRLTLLKPDEVIVMGETPRASLTLFDEDGNAKWVVAMIGVRQMHIARTPIEYEGLRGWHRVRGLRGWFIAGIL